MPAGKLAKLTIVSYSSPSYASSDREGAFTVLINPEEYSRTYKACFNKKQGMNTSSSSPKYNNNPAEEIDLVFYLDGTGVIPKSKPVQDQIKDLKKYAYAYAGKIHEPPYLKLAWGALQFKCRLKEMTIKHILFQPNGMPLRAEVTAKFIEFIDQLTVAQKDNRQSPDMTHVRMVKKGDTLPLMCYKIYGDCKYYLAVAKANNLPNYQSLPIGQRISFPPIKK